MNEYMNAKKNPQNINPKRSISSKGLDIEFRHIVHLGVAHIPRADALTVLIIYKTSF